ncbi:DUF5677 domain-containing protein [Thalassomonas sp. RHCl1]|uniref:DUF5677 domain-containing protein n=1 Tax=Thalassomonas sp. RHCl1 TaxID=2995320 RepID=UPI00248C1F49|nr:DUF5677 domain-containing protein [Thalassomonas sp. RHCl1]
MEAFKQYLDDCTERNKNHLKEIPFILEQYQKLDKIGGELLKDMFNSSLWIVKGIQSYILIRSINELNGSITFSLATKKTAPVETLFRISLEHCINLLYILSDEDNARARSYLKAAITGMESKAAKGNRRAVKDNDLFDQLGMKKRLDFVEYLKKENPNLFTDKELNWPNAFDRFKAVGCEKIYRTMYATASDSIHTMSEDVINAIMVHNSPPEIRGSMADSVESYKLSFSVYLGLFSLKYYCWILFALAKSINSTSIALIDEIENELMEKIISHELETLDELTGNPFRDNYS